MSEEFKPGDKVEWHGPGLVRGKAQYALLDGTLQASRSSDSTA